MPLTFCFHYMQVMSLLRSPVREQFPGSRKGQVLLGKPVCQNAFRRLVGIGPDRYCKLKTAAVKGLPPPVDGRERPRKLDGTNKESLRKRALIEEFLEELFQTLSEPMPELTARKRKLDGEKQVPAMMRFRRRGKMPGKTYRKQQLPADSSEQVAVRLLPPGTFTDYLRMLRAKHPTEKFSLKLFSLDSWPI